MAYLKLQNVFNDMGNGLPIKLTQKCYEALKTKKKNTF